MGEKHSDPIGSKLGMWLFLLSELVLFGGLFLLYSVYRFRYAADFHQASEDLSRTIGTLNTAILLTSSLTMALGIAALQKGRQALSFWLTLVTVALGLVFLGNKYVEWTVKFHHGIYPNAPWLLSQNKGVILFFGLYFTMTGLHGLHVLAGLGVLVAMLVLIGRGRLNSARFVPLENAGLYWHLVDIIWIFLFPLFYLITG
jgi:cytochrome c oxidase subunit 3